MLDSWHIATINSVHTARSFANLRRHPFRFSLEGTHMNKTKTRIKAIVAVGLAILGAALIAAPANAGIRYKP